jgi:hypothetical protein
VSSVLWTAAACVRLAVEEWRVRAACGRRVARDTARHAGRVASRCASPDPLSDPRQQSRDQ